MIVGAKHAVMAGRISFRQTRERPDEVRQSRIDPEVLLPYKAEATRRWTCTVARRLAETEFPITAYQTDAIKEGVRIWLAEVKIFHDREGQTLTVWFTDPSLERFLKLCPRSGRRPNAQCPMPNAQLAARGGRAMSACRRDSASATASV